MLQRTDAANGAQERLKLAKHAARRASLTYVTDADPGIRRRKSGTGFAYVRPNGKPVADRATLKRIERSPFRRPGRTSGSPPTRTATSRRPGATSAAASSTAIMRAGRNAATR